MLQSLKVRIKESYRPVGTKRPNHMKLPPQDHVYGLEGKKDNEGASLSKKKLLLLEYKIY